jgi:hypothetical protein
MVSVSNIEIAKKKNFTQNVNFNELTTEHQVSKYEHRITRILPFQNTQSHEFS